MCQNFKKTNSLTSVSNPGRDHLLKDDRILIASLVRIVFQVPRCSPKMEQKEVKTQDVSWRYSVKHSRTERERPHLLFLKKEQQTLMNALIQTSETRHLVCVVCVQAAGCLHASNGQVQENQTRPLAEQH